MMAHPLRGLSPVAAAVAGAVFQVHRLGQKRLFPTRPAAEIAVDALPEEERPTGEGWFEETLEILTGRALVEAVPAEKASVEPGAQHHAMASEPFIYLVHAGHPPLLPELWRTLVAASPDPVRLAHLAHQATQEPYHLWRPTAEILGRPEVLAAGKHHRRKLLSLLDRLPDSDTHGVVVRRVLRHVPVCDTAELLSLVPRMHAAGSDRELASLTRLIAETISLRNAGPATIRTLAEHGPTEALLILIDRFPNDPPSLHRGGQARLIELHRHVPPEVMAEVVRHCATSTSPTDLERVAFVAEHLRCAYPEPLRNLVLRALERFDPATPEGYRHLLRALSAVEAHEELDTLLRRWAGSVRADARAGPLLRALRKRRRALPREHALLSVRILNEPFFDPSEAFEKLELLASSGREEDFRTLARVLAQRVVPLDLAQLLRLLRLLRHSRSQHRGAPPEARAVVRPEPGGQPGSAVRPGLA